MSFFKSVPDRLILGLVFGALFLINFKYALLVVQIPYALKYSNFAERNSFYKKFKPIAQERKLFGNEKYVGFVSDIKGEDVFLYEDTVKNFYIAQYAVAPSILVPKMSERYVIGIFDKKVPDLDMKMHKKLTDKIFVYECTKCVGKKSDGGA